MTWPTDDPAPLPLGVWQAIRRDDAGAVDDIAISCDMFRLERMTDGEWWCCVSRGTYPDVREVHFWLRRVGKRIEVTVTDDTLGCVDDSRPLPGSSAGSARGAMDRWLRG